MQSPGDLHVSNNAAQRAVFGNVLLVPRARRPLAHWADRTLRWWATPPATRHRDLQVARGWALSVGLRWGTGQGLSAAGAARTAQQACGVDGQRSADAPLGSGSVQLDGGPNAVANGQVHADSMVSPAASADGQHWAGAAARQSWLLCLAAARPSVAMPGHVAGQEGTQPGGMSAAGTARLVPPYAGRLCWLGRASCRSALCRPCMLRCRRRSGPKDAAPALGRASAGVPPARALRSRAPRASRRAAMRAPAAPSLATPRAAARAWATTSMGRC